MVERSDRFGIIPGFQARKKFLRAVLVGVILVGLIPGCSVPTLVEVARRRQGSAANGSSGQSVKDDVRVKYYVTDLDVLNFTDEVKRKLMNRANLHVGFAYGTSAAGLTLGSLSGAAKAIGWGVSTASGLGLGAAYMFAMGKLFDPGGKAQAYEQSFTAIQAAEANYYFRQLGMGFDPKTGRLILGDEAGRADIPSGEVLTPDGEILYYRVTKILKVLNDTLSSKIPDVQDLQDAQGQITSPRPTPIPPTGGKANPGSGKGARAENGGEKPIPHESPFINSNPSPPPKPAPFQTRINRLNKQIKNSSDQRIAEIYRSAIPIKDELGFEALAEPSDDKLKKRQVFGAINNLLPSDEAKLKLWEGLFASHPAQATAGSRIDVLNRQLSSSSDERVSKIYDAAIKIKGELAINPTADIEKPKDKRAFVFTAINNLRSKDDDAKIGLWEGLFATFPQESQ